jgi:hypothetical protein
MRPREYDQYHLPRRIQKLQGATHVIFGDAVISTPDTCIGVETCVCHRFLKLQLAMLTGFLGGALYSGRASHPYGP